MAKLSICIVNYNCLRDTTELLHDLNRQTVNDYHLYFYDQNSSEVGTDELLDQLSKQSNVVVTKHGENMPLNHVWNKFANEADSEYIMFLNNDIRIPSNYVYDTIEVLNKDKRIGIVVHATNNRKYSTASAPTRHIFENNFVKQGWDFALRKNDWKDIPEVLKFYCGDDFIFQQLHKQGLKTGVVTSSPIIHKLSQTRKNMPKAEAQSLKEQAKLDIANYKKLGFKHVWNNIPKLSKLEDPSLTQITELNQEKKKSKPKDYEQRLVQHLYDVEDMSGCILDLGISNSSTLKILENASKNQSKKFVMMEGSITLENDIIIPESRTIDGEVQGERISSFQDLTGPPAFIFFGVFQRVNVLRLLDEIWKVAIPGTTIFFPYYHYKSNPEVAAAVDSFFSDKHHQILKSRPQTRPGIRDTYLVVKCFKSPKSYKINRKPLTVASVLKSGGTYNEDYVNKLAAAVKRHLRLDHEFVCLTDMDENKINSELVDRIIPLEFDLTGWWSKLELFRPELCPGNQILYFDLDTLIVDNIDEFGEYGGKFLALRDFNVLTTMGSGILSWDANSYNHIFYKSISGIMNNRIKFANYVGGDQQLIELLIGHRPEWVQDIFPKKMASFKYECWKGENRVEGTLTIPEKTSVICFHGQPKMGDIVNNKVIKEHWRV